MKAREFIDVYAELVKAGATLDHHEGDLYVKVDEVARPIVARAKANGWHVTTFTSNLDGLVWFEIPFACCCDMCTARWKARTAR